MQLTTLFLILIAVLFSISVAYYQYFYQSKDTRNRKIILFSLRGCSLFLLLLLFINPTILKTVVENTKPLLSILIDNSASTKFFKEEATVHQLVRQIKDDAALNSKFKLQYFSFGKNIKVMDSLSFDTSETNISKGIQAVNELHQHKNQAIVLVSDGNQTAGNDYEYTKSNHPIYPVVIGDTTRYKDVRIRQLNVNKYSYINNKFPVEAMLFYEGEEPVSTQFVISKKGKVVFSQRVRFSASEKSKTIVTNLTSTTEGVHFYKASVRKLTDEKNIKNNTKNFSVEVINEQTKILLVSAVLHPDLGALKKSIEKNKQRSVDIVLIDELKKDLKDYQLIILYQPNLRFTSLISKIKKEKANYFLISGANTDWNFINQQQLGVSKNTINQTENYTANFNESFLTFLQNDIGFEDFSPLKDKFGEVNITQQYQVLLFQKISGIKTSQPLLATFEQQNQKAAVLFGEGIWKWRATSFLNSNSFEDFDAFISNLIQYTASNKKRSRLEVNAERVYPSNSTILISAFYTDKNYQFDERASLEIAVTNLDTKERINIPFSLVNKSFQVAIENLTSGNYSYTVSVKGQQISKSGRFLISDFKIEEQFTNANVAKLKILANKTGGSLYNPSNMDELLVNFKTDERYVTTQKSTVKEQNLIDWKWVLFLVIILLSIEWFTRKYYGKI